MAERKWTAAQKAAIDFGRGNLLVSAAAGSGKTATLTERIIRLVRDGDADISRMLIVTFTEAAAAELKERIRAELTKAVAKDKTNRRLIRQLSDLPRADICTIHSFCLKILKPHFSELGLPPDFRVGEEGMCRVLKADIMRDTVNEYFEAVREGRVSSDVADTLGGSRDESALDAVLLKFAEALASRGFEADKLYEYADALENDAHHGFMTSAYGEAPRRAMLRAMEHYRAIFTDAVDDFSGDEVLTAKYLPAAVNCLEFAERIIRALKDGGEFPTDHERVTLKPLKAEFQTPMSLYFKEMRGEFFACIDRFSGDYLYIDDLTNTVYVLANATLLRLTAPILARYFELYAKAKRERGIVDFGDLEFLAAKLLYDPDGTPSDIASELALKYDYIFIDEYQDTNRVQDKIFSAVAKASSRFLVGDIKQSIYRFRGAEPEVFAEYRRAWTGGEGESVFMQDNFRCDENVVDFVNLVSRYVFSTGSIPFDEGDELRHGKSEDAPDAPHVEVCIISSAKTDGENDHINPEAEYVAERIAELLRNGTTEGGRPIRPSDIAILMRSPGSASADFIGALDRRGIKTSASAPVDFFTLPEILLALCILNTVDNPTRDVYLAGAMRSPVFGFTADELAVIRTIDKSTSLWQAVRRYGDEGEAHALRDKCTDFVSRQRRLRTECASMPAHKAIDLIFADTALFDLNYDTPSAKDNLTALYEMSRQYDSGVYSGLYGFLTHISELIDSGKSDGARESDDGDAVSIMSIHHSKGLEYPVVFLADTARKFNMQDKRDNLLFDDKFGPAMRLHEGSEFLRFDTPQRQSAALRIEEGAIEEEMRVLYVALTRARSKLIVTAKTKSPEELVAAVAGGRKYLSEYSVYSANNYISWIIGAMVAEDVIGGDLETHSEQCILKYIDRADVPVGRTAAAAAEAKELDTAEVDEYRALIAERLAFRYPYEHRRIIPAKLTVSKLSPDILDPLDTSAVLTVPSDETEARAIPVPKFLTEQAGYTPAEAGIATHLFMQFCDFARLKAVGADRELSRLVADGFIPREIADRVDIFTVRRFAESELFIRMGNARDIRREFRFNASMPASRFTDDAELKAKFDGDGSLVTVQGVIDCVFVDEGGKLVLVDYKTDHFSRDMLKNDRDGVRGILRDRHTAQLGYYRDIIGEMFGRPVDETYIYSLALGESVEVY